MGSFRLDIPGNHLFPAGDSLSSRQMVHPRPLTEGHSEAAYLLFGSANPPLSRYLVLKRYGPYVADIVELCLPIRLSMATQFRMAPEVGALAHSLDADLQNMIIYGLIGSRYLRPTDTPGPGGIDWAHDLLFELDAADADLKKLAQAKFSKNQY